MWHGCNFDTWEQPAYLPNLHCESLLQGECAWHLHPAPSMLIILNQLCMPWLVHTAQQCDAGDGMRLPTDLDAHKGARGWRQGALPIASGAGGGCKPPLPGTSTTEHRRRTAAAAGQGRTTLQGSEERPQRCTHVRCVARHPWEPCRSVTRVHMGNRSVCAPS